MDKFLHEYQFQENGLYPSETTDRRPLTAANPVVPLKKQPRTSSLINTQLTPRKLETPSTVRSTAGSSTSEISGTRSRLGSRQKGNIAKMKEVS